MIGGELQFNPKQHRYLKAFPNWYLLESRKKPMRIAISWLMSNVECRTRHIFYLTCHNRLWNIIFHKNQSNIAIPYTQQTSLKKQILYAIQYAYMKNVAAPFFSCLSEESLELYNFKLTSGLDSEHFLHITFNQNLLYRSWINYIFPIHHVQCPGRLDTITAWNTTDLSSANSHLCTETIVVQWCPAFPTMKDLSMHTSQMRNWSPLSHEFISTVWDKHFALNAQYFSQWFNDSSCPNRTPEPPVQPGPSKPKGNSK